MFMVLTAGGLGSGGAAGDFLSLLLVVAAIAFVLYLSYVFSRYLSRKGAKISQTATYMKVIDRMPVGQDRYMLILKIQEKYYLVSATAQEIRILRELDGFAETQPSGGEPPSLTESFKTVLGQMMTKKK